MARMTRRRNTPAVGILNTYTGKRKVAGEILYFAGAVPPVGFLAANGQLVSRATYGNLFAAIGVTYGAGDGSTTFAVPDLRGEFIRGLDAGRGVDTGRVIGSAQTAMIPDHQHPNVPSFSTAGGAGGAVNVQTGSGGSTGGVNSISGAVSLGNDNRPRNIAMLPCIQY